MVMGGALQQEATAEEETSQRGSLSTTIQAMAMEPGAMEVDATTAGLVVRESSTWRAHVLVQGTSRNVDARSAHAALWLRFWCSWCLQH